MSDPLDTLLDAFGLLLHWRFVLAFVAGCAAALAMAHHIDAYVAPHGIALALAGVAFGLLWELRAERGQALFRPLEEEQIDPGSTLCVILPLGLYAGAFLRQLSGSAFLPALLLPAGVALLAGGLRLFLHRQPSRVWLVGNGGALLGGYALLLLLARLTD
jgi:hypothetical protein